MSAQALTPPRLAALWGCSPERIVALIRAGRLRGFTTSDPGCSRPRWKIPPDAVAEFEARNRPSTSSKPARSRQKPAGFVEYV